ncbi:hypothetical protein Dimus_036542 [Dionaea muscipula]
MKIGWVEGGGGCRSGGDEALLHLGGGSVLAWWRGSARGDDDGRLAWRPMDLDDGGDVSPCSLLVVRGWTAAVAAWLAAARIWIWLGGQRCGAGLLLPGGGRSRFGRLVDDG